MGSWEPIHTEVWDTVVTPCDCCGQVVVRRRWIAEISGERRQLCSQECEALYRRYIMKERTEEQPRG